MINDPSKLDLNLLRVFDALMRHRGVTAASRDLGLTQSSVSNALNRLRSALGDRLLERQGNAMVPTLMAEALWPFAAEALGAIASGLASTRRFEPATASVRFRIGMDDYALALLAPGLSAAIAGQAPNVCIDFLPTRHPDDEDALRTGALDLFLGSVWQGSREFEHRTILTEDFVGLAAPSLLATARPMDLETFLAHPHILVSSRGRVQGNIDAALAAIGKGRDVKIALSEFDVAARVAAAGLGYFSCGRRLAQRFVAAYGLRAFDLPLAVPGFELRLLWSRRNSLAPSHQWLRQVLVETSRTLSATDPLPSKSGLT